jgi:hypothetical protein
MSKRIVISESEKNRIKSLYINESTSLEGKIFQVNVDGDLRNYRITDIQSDKKGEGKFVIYTNQERTNERSGGKWFGGKKQFYFDCTLPDLYGYDSRIINSEKYSSSSNDDLKSLIQSLQKELCG